MKIILFFSVFITGCTTSQIYTSRTTANDINAYAQTFLGPNNQISQTALNYQSDIHSIMGAWNDPVQTLMFLPQYYLY